MMSSQAVKKNLSGIQVLKTLAVLLDGDYTMQQLIEKLNKDEPKPVFNNSVISKYINTCRQCDIEIPKIHNKYIVARIPFGLNLNSDEQTLLYNMQSVVRDNMSSRQNKLFDAFMEKINKFSNKQIVRIEKKSAKYFYEAFDKAIQEKRKIRLLFKAKMEMECIPVRVDRHNAKTYFIVLFRDKERMIAEERLAGLEILREKFIERINDQVVVYKLTGDLAYKYTLRENENYMSRYDDCCTISNHGENKEILFSRLLRYGSSCVILNPKEYQREMKLLLDSTLSNYGV